MSKARKMVIQFLLLYAVLCQTQGFLFLKPMKNEITLNPSDRKYVVVGNTLLINCSKTDSASSIYLNKNNITMKSEILDKDTIGFNLTSDKQISYIITCTDGIPDNTKSVQVPFGYLPKIENVRFQRNVSRYFMMFLTPVKNIEYSKSEYWKIVCTYTNDRKTWLSCDSECKSTFCGTDGIGKVLFRFIVTGNNHFGNISESFREYESNELIVQLPPINGIKYEFLSPGNNFKSSVNTTLIYNNNPQIVAFRKEYRISYRSKWDARDHWENITSPNNEIVLKDLVPFTNYSVIAEARVRNAMYWSPPLQDVFKTPPSAPSAGPKTTNGSYYEGNCSKKTRCLTLYWKSLESKLRNDVLAGYCVQYIGGNILYSKTNSCKNLASNRLYKDFTGLPKDKTLLFSITAVTINNKQSPPTFIQVTTKAPSRPKAVYVVQRSDNTYNVSWLLDQPQKGTNVTVFWCNDDMQSDIQCKDQVKWQTVMNMNYLLLNSTNKEPPSFAAFVTTAQGTSSLTKAECIFNNGIAKMPKQPKLDWFTNKFTLTWPHFTCEELNRIPIAFNILYAKGSNCINGEVIQRPASGIQPDQYSTDSGELDPGTEYSVCIQTETEGGVRMMSKVITNETKKEVNLGLAIGISASIIILVLLSLGFWKAKKWTQRMGKKHIVKMPALEYDPYTSIGDGNLDVNSYSIIGSKNSDDTTSTSIPYSLGKVNGLQCKQDEDAIDNVLNENIDEDYLICQNISSNDSEKETSNTPILDNSGYVAEGQDFPNRHSAASDNQKSLSLKNENEKSEVSKNINNNIHSDYIKCQPLQNEGKKKQPSLGYIDNGVDLDVENHQHRITDTSNKPSLDYIGNGVDWDVENPQHRITDTSNKPSLDYISNGVDWDVENPQDIFLTKTKNNNNALYEDKGSVRVHLISQNMNANNSNQREDNLNNAHPGYVPAESSMKDMLSPKENTNDQFNRLHMNEIVPHPKGNELINSSTTERHGTKNVSSISGLDSKGYVSSNIQNASSDSNILFNDHQKPKEETSKCPMCSNVNNDYICEHKLHNILPMNGEIDGAMSM